MEGNRYFLGRRLIWIGLRCACMLVLVGSATLSSLLVTSAFAQSNGDDTAGPPLWGLSADDTAGRPIFGGLVLDESNTDDTVSQKIFSRSEFQNLLSTYKRFEALVEMHQSELYIAARLEAQQLIDQAEKRLDSQFNPGLDSALRELRATVRSLDRGENTVLHPTRFGSDELEAAFPVDELTDAYVNLHDELAVLDGRPPMDEDAIASLPWKLPQQLLDHSVEWQVEIARPKEEDVVRAMERIESAESPTQRGHAVAAAYELVERSDESVLRRALSQVRAEIWSARGRYRSLDMEVASQQQREDAVRRLTVLLLTEAGLGGMLAKRTEAVSKEAREAMESRLKASHAKVLASKPDYASLESTVMDNETAILAGQRLIDRAAAGFPVTAFDLDQYEQVLHRVYRAEAILDQVEQDTSFPVTVDWRDSDEINEARSLIDGLALAGEFADEQDFKLLRTAAIDSRRIARARAVREPFSEGEIASFLLSGDVDDLGQIALELFSTRQERERLDLNDSEQAELYDAGPVLAADRLDAGQARRNIHRRVAAFFLLAKTDWFSTQSHVLDQVFEAAEAARRAIEAYRQIAPATREGLLKLFYGLDELSKEEKLGIYSAVARTYRDAAEKAAIAAEAMGAAGLVETARQWEAWQHEIERSGAVRAEGFAVQAGVPIEDLPDEMPKDPDDQTPQALADLFPVGLPVDDQVWLSNGGFDSEALEVHPQLELAEGDSAPEDPDLSYGDFLHRLGLDNLELQAPEIVDWSAVRQEGSRGAGEEASHRDQPPQDPVEEVFTYPSFYWLSPSTSNAADRSPADVTFPDSLKIVKEHLPSAWRSPAEVEQEQAKGPAETDKDDNNVAKPSGSLWDAYLGFLTLGVAGPAYYARQAARVAQLGKEVKLAASVTPFGAVSTLLATAVTDYMSDGRIGGEVRPSCSNGQTAKMYCERQISTLPSCRTVCVPDPQAGGKENTPLENQSNQPDTELEAITQQNSSPLDDRDRELEAISSGGE